jgi:lactoylglutathione lyase
MFHEAFPIIHADDVDRLVAFYADAFGFELGYRFPGEGAIEYAFMRLRPLGIGIGRYPDTDATRDAVPPARPGFELWIYANDVDAAVERVCNAGATLLERATDRPWGERVAFVADPEGHRIHIGAPLGPGPGLESGPHEPDR